MINMMIEGTEGDLGVMKEVTSTTETDIETNMRVVDIVEIETGEVENVMTEDMAAERDIGVEVETGMIVEVENAAEKDILVEREAEAVLHIRKGDLKKGPGS